MEFNEKENRVLYDFGKMHKGFGGREARKKKAPDGLRGKKAHKIARQT